MRALAARKSKIAISSQKSAKRSQRIKRPQLWRCLSLVVKPADISPAAALLESATGRLAAIESIDHRHAKVSVHVPASQNYAAKVKRSLSGVRRHEVLCDAELNEVEVRDEAWASSWKQYYKPFLLAPGLYIVPSWQRHFKSGGRARVLRLDPGMAFGTGQHPTTKLAADMLLHWLEPDDVVIDVGCGSGILALAAASGGAQVYANDCDAIAVAATMQNFARNKLQAVSIRKARGVPAVFPRARIVTANITARVLVPLATQLAAKLQKGGILITSGLVEGGRRGMLDALQQCGLTLVEERREGEWFAHVHRKAGR